MASVGSAMEEALHMGQYKANRSFFCFEPNEATSSGVFTGDDPLKFYFPLLLYHVCMVYALSHAVHAVLSRLNVPLVISQIAAGALLGPSFLGLNPQFAEFFAMPEGWMQLNTIGAYAFTLFIFTIGVRTDLGMIARSGKKAVAIAVLGATAPHLAMYFTSVAVGRRLPAAWGESFLLVNLTSWWSLSPFLVICCTLRDLELLSSKLGRLAMSAALIGDFANTFIVAGVTSYLLSASPSEKLQKIGFTSLIAFIAFFAFIVLVARPVIVRLIRDVPEGALLDEGRLVAVLLIALGCGLAGELLGLHATYGPFMLGLVLPGGAPLGVTMAERLDRMVAGVLLPLFLAQGGMRVNFGELADASTCCLLELLLIVGSVTKFVASVLPCIYCRMPIREAVVVGLMMNFRGITEVAYAAMWMDSKMLDGQAYTVFMLTVLLTGGTTASMVKFMYRPEEKFVAYRRRTVQHAKPGEELRVLACVHSQHDVGAALSLLSAFSPSPATPVAVYLLHLVPLAGLTSSVLRPFKHGDIGSSDSERIVNAFHGFAQQWPPGSVSVLPYVCISPYATMHDDICAVALEKRAMLILAPFHKRLAIDGSIEPASSNAGAIRAVNINVLSYSPCSVAILVGLAGFSPAADEAAAAAGLAHRVALYFLGGPDDREALALATHMVEDASVGLTVFRFMLPPQWQQCSDGEEDRLDEEALQAFVQRWADDHRVVYSEEVVSTSDEMAAVVRKTSSAFNMLMVGRRAESEESPLTAGISDWSEHPELGVVGDLLASTDFECRVPTLVVQQQTRAAAGESTPQLRLAEATGGQWKGQGGSDHTSPI